MPIYEYLCRDCDTRFDDLVSITQTEAQACPSCESSDTVKLYSPFKVGVGAGASSSSTAGGACMPGAAGRGGGGGCCGGGCGGCG